MTLSVQTIIFRIILAIVIGGVVGSERENQNSPAGFRTHILVCVGTTIISLMSLELFNESIRIAELSPLHAGIIKVDLARLGAQAITGIGFLGAGTIIQSKGLIRGLTTAATLWVVAVIGLAAGMGFYRITFTGTIAIFLTLVTLKKFQKKYMNRAKLDVFEVYFKDEEKGPRFVEQCFYLHNIIVEEIQKCYDVQRRFEVKAENIQGNRYSVLLPQNVNIHRIMEALNRDQSIAKVSYRADIDKVDGLN